MENIFNQAIALDYRTASNPAIWRGLLSEVLPSTKKVHKVTHRPAIHHKQLSQFVKILIELDISRLKSDLDEFEFSNHLYERGAELTSYVGTLFSDWNDRFSTQIRVSHLELDNRQLSVGGTDFGEIRVELDDVDVYLGGDDSRQSNKLYYEVDSLSFRGTYDMNNHAITAGFEYESLDIFNLFVQHSETEIRFEGIDNFRNGFADAIYYNNAPSNNATDAAADWGYEVGSAVRVLGPRLWSRAFFMFTLSSCLSRRQNTARRKIM